MTAISVRSGVTALAAILCSLVVFPGSAAAQNAIPEPCRFSLFEGATTDGCIDYVDRIRADRRTAIARAILLGGPDSYPPDLLRQLAARVPSPENRSLRALAMVETVEQSDDNIEAGDIVKALEDAIAARNAVAAAYLRFAQALKATQDGNWEAVSPALDKARTSARRERLPGLSGLIDFAAGEQALRDQDFAEAEKWLSRAYASQIRNDRRDRAAASCELLAGSFAYNMENTTEQLQQRARRLSDPARPCRVTAVALRGQRTEAPLDEMEPLAKAALRVIDDHGLDRMKPHLLNSVGITASRDGEYHRAARYFVQAERGFRASGDEFMAAAAAANQADNLSEIGANDRAAEIMEKSLATFRRVAPDRLDAILKAERHIAIAHEREGRPKMAIAWFERAMETSQAFPMRYYDGLVGSDLARVLYEIGEIDRAMDIADRSVTHLLAHWGAPDTAAAARTLTWMASHYLAERNTDKAGALLARATRMMDPDGRGADVLLQPPGDLFSRLEYARNMANLLSQVGRPEEANAYSRVALQLSETRLEEEKLRAMANVDLQMAIGEQETRLAEMRQEARISELTLRNNRLSLLASLTAALLAALVALIVYRFYRRQKRMTTAKDTFLSEIHHRTSNNLQLIVSLLRVDRGRGDDRIGDAANRARTMALVHNHIFMDGRDRAKASVFLHDLAELLHEALGSERIELRVTSDDIDLPAGAVTPIGLLACEAVTNAYKYAFPDGRAGEIAISLSRETNGLRLVVRDDGIGTDTIVPSQGSYLLEDLADQLGARLERRSSPGQGTEVVVAGIKVDRTTKRLQHA